MKQQLAKLCGAAPAGLEVAPLDHRLYFQDTPVYPRQVTSTVAMPAFIEVAREWVQNAQMHAWLARVLEDLGGEHPVPALPSCGICDALVLVLLESLQNLHSAVCQMRRFPSLAVHPPRRGR